MEYLQMKEKSERLEYLKENKCIEFGCYNYRKGGYVHCSPCMYGGGNRMNDEDIKLLKENGM